VTLNVFSVIQYYYTSLLLIYNGYYHVYLKSHTENTFFCTHYITYSVAFGQCDTRHSVTFLGPDFPPQIYLSLTLMGDKLQWKKRPLVTEQHRHLASTEFYCLITGAVGVNVLSCLVFLCSFESTSLHPQPCNHSSQHATRCATGT